MGGWDFAAEVMGPREMEAQGGKKERDKKEFDVGGKHKWLKGVLSIPEMDIFSSHFVVIVQ